MNRLGDQIEAAVHHAVQKELIVSPVPAGHKTLESLMLIGSAKDNEKTSPGGKARSESHEASLGNRFIILGGKMAEAATGKRLYLTAQDSRTYPLVLVPGPTGRRFYISGDHPAPDGLYTLTLGPAPEGLDKVLKIDRSPAGTMLKYDRKNDEFKADINPFGSYHGKQNRRPTWGNGQGHEATLISGEQYHSAAPTYNGSTSRFALMIGFFDGNRIPEQMKRMLDAHANPARVYGMNRQSVITAKKAAAPLAYSAAIDGDRVTFSWEKTTLIQRNISCASAVRQVVTHMYSGPRKPA